jgi:DNA-binding transcriptional LysR family regulator
MNLNRFDLASLRLFVAVVDAGSLTAGADRFGISLAAASKRIAELEQHCEMPLLQRNPRGVTVTQHGQTLHRHAIEVVARLEQLALAVDDFQTGTVGHLRLWANPSALGGFLPKLLGHYAALHPEVRIDLNDALSEEAVRAVVSGSAEVAVIGENTPVEGLETLLADVDELVLLVPRYHALAGQSGQAGQTGQSIQRPVPFSHALDQDFVALARSASLTRKVQAAAEATGRSLRIRVQVRSFDAMARMVASGLGVAILPRAGALLYADALALSVLELEGLDVRRRLLVAMKRRSALSPAASALVDLIEARQRDQTPKAQEALQIE